MTTPKKLWIAIGIMVFLAPVGVILPTWFGAEGAWGEWGLNEIEKIAGFVPAGMRRLAELWKAPMAAYAVPGQRTGLLGESVGYVLTGIIGVAITAGAMYSLAKLLARKNDPDRSDKE